MPTFTGERVIPGAVEPDLWNEHVSRYYFACEFAPNRRLLDVGCGTGYGTNLVGALAAAGSLGMDVSPETIQYAASRAENGVQFCVGSADALPLPDRSFGLVTAFEIIEHIPGWRALVSEAARVLTGEGIFLVSTPNKAYYAESRQEAGPNPFHFHEFEPAEFEDALREAFAYVRILAQNHQDTLTFAGENSAGFSAGRLLTPPALDQSHFLAAVCSQTPVQVPAFFYAASGGNLLKDRETYIHALKREVDSLQTDRSRLLDQLHKTSTEFETANTQLQKAVSEFQEVNMELQRANAELGRLQQERKMAAQSKWLRLGRSLGLGPKLQ